MAWGTHFQNCLPEKLLPAAAQPWKSQHPRALWSADTGLSCPHWATRCEPAWAQGPVPAYTLLNLPVTRKYELGGFCPQASVLWTKLHLCRLLLSFASTSTIYPTGAFLTFYKQNRMPDMEPAQERNSSAPLQSWVSQSEGLLPTGQVAPIRDRANYEIKVLCVLKIACKQ